MQLYLASILFAYLVGSLMPGIWIPAFFRHIEIRDHGSGNPGLTNVLRTCGWKYALPVGIIDTGKGFLAAYMAQQFVPDSDWLPLVAGVAAILGHSFTCFGQFRGGKGVLTAWGVFLFIAAWQALLAFGIFAVVTATTRYMSLGSILAANALAAAVTYSWSRGELHVAIMILGWFIGIFVTWRHRTNIGRLLSGTESRLGEKREKS